MSYAVYALPNHAEQASFAWKAGKWTHGIGDNCTYHMPNHPFGSLSVNAALREGKVPDNSREELPQNGVEQNPRVCCGRGTRVKIFGFVKRG
jgi:hypothetical protein